MANPVYKRVPTDQQSTDRQNLVLDEAGIEEPVVLEEEGGTSSRLHPLERPEFADPLTYARPGDTVHISGMFRLVRGTQHILAVLDRGVTVRRGQGCTLRITAVPAIHRRLLGLCQTLGGAAAVPAQRKARREYENRVNLHAPTTDLGSQSRSAA
ncbi:hypothetical protein GCM10019016_016480 [Streptomyces prasinosporus]|uniref:Resolvase/invertase-type recombinase catalytic domain-containing protein n=1 Tax=Streptomyces prasinosporus TaxID=68256 RepID=A0ABP6TJ58_9ACTN